MARLLRRSFAAPLVAGAWLLALVLTAAVAGYLIASRSAQTQSAALSNADNRAGVMAQVLDRFTAVEALSAARSLASKPALAAALTGPEPGAAVTQLLGGGAPVDLAGEILMVADANGTPLYVRRSPTLPAAPQLVVAPPAVREALAGGACGQTPGLTSAGACGVETLGDGEVAYAVAVPVTSAATRAGVVAYLAPLAYQLQRFQALFNFPTAFVAAANTASVQRSAAGSSGFAAPALRDALRADDSVHHAVYAAPGPGGRPQTVAGSFRAVRASNGAVTGYVGVEVPLATFAGDERTDILAVALIALFVLVVIATVVVLFVERFVRRPVARLGRGVARIAGGDYDTPVQVSSENELGRLARDVNRMRESIAGYVQEVLGARRRLDASVARVGDVSRALTTTSTGVAALHEAVTRTAASIGDSGGGALLAVRDGGALVVRSIAGDVRGLAAVPGDAGVLAGETVETRLDGGALAVAAPMFARDEVVGALVRVAPGGGDVAASSDVAVLQVLANNAAIAMDNARLLEQERETVRRLLELDAMKSDFLATVQHELRTPLTAIMGMADLLEMCWQRWEESSKVDAVRDIQVAARNLYDIIETIIDYSVLADERMDLHRDAVRVADAVAEAVAAAGERYRDGLLVPVDVQGADDVTVFADRDRFVQVLRAVVDNGQKFSEGRGRMTVGFATVDAGSAVRIEISDQGPGIAEEDMPRIFDRFFQADNSATRRFGGTGMGLALVKRMVTAHGGAIDVVSEPGGGTRVELMWPAPVETPAD